MPQQKTAKIIQLLLAGKSATALIAEKFPETTVWRWSKKLKADPSAGDKYLQKAKAGAPGGDKGDGTGELGAKVEGKETQLPPTFRFPVTIKLEWDNIYFYYRAKANAYPGDISAFVNEGLRDLFQLQGFKITTIMDAEKAKELAAQYLLPEVETKRG